MEGWDVGAGPYLRRLNSALVMRRGQRFESARRLSLIGVDTPDTRTFGRAQWLKGCRPRCALAASCPPVQLIRPRQPRPPWLCSLAGYARPLQPKAGSSASRIRLGSNARGAGEARAGRWASTELRGVSDTRGH